MNMQKMMQQAQQMQQKMQDAQDNLGNVEVTGDAGAGMVQITMNCKHDVKKVQIDPKIVDADDVEMLEDLIVAAFNDANKKTETASADEMSKVTAGMNLPAGMKLPF